MKILMVCLGNICRSPLADGLMRAKVKQRNLDIEVDSAGTAAFHIGKYPDLRTQVNAISHGVDLSPLRARQFCVEDFDRFDRIFAMDKENLSNIYRLARNEADKQKVQLMLKLIPNSAIIEVPDPYYGGDQGFERVFQLLNEATDQLTQQLS
jgi:protein-tyrosine phosphatase